ncbi:Coenzyme F420 hydrogenase/dehydrogenase, beta subunit C-terminal domain [Desulfonatronospira sp. MSAO_Bac3]|uniref:Coenzyme F420 hydrogenase/dehydrogenase, beta subunit C-terminal domain n=1 Tax=Desulfonatronospira sp. MSAO_Bac3 TaxID=2293857 RepID=UPI00257F8EA2|nr:Coenzyme F420 hydrogenase/dehydrogenase, beta subunit C-terminal domain [Desulfonatronospira sp. MSAO_Bac3]
MRSFDDLIQQVQEKYLCNRCGGCVTFCKAINYGALEVDKEGYPRYKDKEACIECGICHMLCPENEELYDEVKQHTGWSEPAGNIVSSNILRAKDPDILERATDGGAVTGILKYLMETGQIDSAIVSRHIGLFNREPFLARSTDELISACGSHFDTSHGMVRYSEHYSTFTPSIQAMGELKNSEARRVAFVGTPCQVATLRKMQALGVVPSDTIQCVLGLFCSGNFAFEDSARKRLEGIGRFDWNEVKKINIKDKMYLYMQDGTIHTLPLDELDFIMRPACRYCTDYTAEFADISFGGMGSDEGWTTVIARTRLGMDILNKAEGTALESYLASKRAAGSEDEKSRQRIMELRRNMRHRKYSKNLGDEQAQQDPEYQKMASELKHLEEKFQDAAPSPNEPASQTNINNTLNLILEKSSIKRENARKQRQELGTPASSHV